MGVSRGLFRNTRIAKLLLQIFSIFFIFFLLCVCVDKRVPVTLLYLGLLQLLCRLDIYYYIICSNYFFTSLVCVTVWIDIFSYHIFTYFNILASGLHSIYQIIIKHMFI